MKSVLMLIIFLCIHVSKLFAQTNNFARNTVGIFTGIEMNTISGLWGLQYERSLHQQDKLNISAKALYIFRYELGNMKLLGGSCCEYYQSATLLATASRFTSPTAKPNRFYLQAGLGAGIKTYAFENLRQQSVFPAFEAGFGFKLPMNDQLILQWHNSFLFLHNNGATINVGLSLGF